MARIFKVTSIFLVLCISMLVFSCKKNNANTDGDTFVPPDITAPAYSFSRFDANGLLLVQQKNEYYTHPFDGLIETISKEATARFKSSALDSAYRFAGGVFCESRQLAFQKDSSYVVGGNSAGLISFKDTLGVLWDVTGNAVAGIPAFTFTTTVTMPSYKGIGNNSIPSTIMRSAGSIIPLGANIVGADSIFISITSKDKSVQKTIGAANSKCEFSNTELSSLPSSNGQNAKIQVSPIKYDLSLQGGKKIYFANQMVYTKIIEVK